MRILQKKTAMSTVFYKIQIDCSHSFILMFKLQPQRFYPVRTICADNDYYF